MSSFAALNGAYTSLTAQRIALEVTSQNISNVNTPGYTRQRASLAAIGSPASTLFGSSATRATGVTVASVDRLTDAFLETRLRTQTSAAARLTAVAESWSLLETTVAEPSENGLAAGLDTFFNAWHDVANRPDDGAAKAVLLGDAASLAADITAGYRAAEQQWDATRTQVDALAQDVSTTAAAVADLNARIRDALNAGEPVNSLLDERGLLVSDLAHLVGGEVRERPDGTVDVLVGGSALVEGGRANAVAVHGSPSMTDLGTTPPAGWGTAEGPVRLVWADSGAPAAATGGRLTGLVEVLAPADQSGPLAGLARSYDTLATTLAGEVNTLHASLPGADGTHRDFFTLDAARPALSLEVALTHVDQVTTGNPGEVDGSLAARIAELSDTRTAWASTVVDLGVNTRTAVRRAEAAEGTRATAEAQLLSQTAVDLDEESVNLVMYQRAYEAAARVLTTVDEMLDTLINRTGVVGR
ncbi:flagellar hook-associated protein FlgK [uncultured Georgenia sp.]|uniref:flagellar hook-associated protein FlgK n=1 Tax=uncultured Georgenia sp. TaxID=378209 RepID=UPI00262376AD|nr:flagellar hook-associated protein FlgK [uncultured Georgenia sp.]